MDKAAAAAAYKLCAKDLFCTYYITTVTLTYYVVKYVAVNGINCIISDLTIT